MPVYNFDQQHHIGGKGEGFLDGFFKERGHYVMDATRGQQRAGIDRVFLWDGKMAYVEYKTDFLAHQTGKVFIETISVDTEDKPGWAYSSRADYLVYFIPGQHVIYVIPLEYLRQHVDDWCQKYPVRSAQNEDYATHGVLVPIPVFAQHATQIFNLD